MKLHLILILVLTFSFSVFGQTATVISENANLRGTAKQNGKVVTQLSNNTQVEIIKKRGVWYLVQSEEYVGWLHGNTISLNTEQETVVVRVPQPLPPGSYVPNENASSPISSEYIGGNVSPTINIDNDSAYTLNLEFGGATYRIPPHETKTISMTEGAYRYNASAPGVRGTGGVKQFSNGYSYSWKFYVVTTRI